MTTYTPSDSGARWQDLHREMWTALVPRSGRAATTQGELIRLTGKLAREILDNGSVNWGPPMNSEFERLGRLLLDGSLPDDVHATAAAAHAQVKAQLANLVPPKRELYQLSEAAVRWVLARPQLIPLDD